MKLDRDKLTEQAADYAEITTTKVKQIAAPALAKTADGLTTVGEKLGSTAEKLDDSSPSTLVKVSKLALLGAGAAAVYVGVRMARQAQQAQPEGDLQSVPTYPEEAAQAQQAVKAGASSEVPPIV